jgi:hypothetical protein
VSPYAAPVRSARLTRLAIATAAACLVAGGGAIVVTDDWSTAEASAAPATRYHDLEANKARSMHALGLHMAARAR